MAREVADSVPQDGTAAHHLAPLGDDRWLVTHVDGTDRRTAVAGPPPPAPLPERPAPPAGADTGRLLVRNLCMRFDRYLDTTERFSTTI